MRVSFFFSSTFSTFFGGVADYYYFIFLEKNRNLEDQKWRHLET